MSTSENYIFHCQTLGKVFDTEWQTPSRGTNWLERTMHDEKELRNHLAQQQVDNFL